MTRTNREEYTIEKWYGTRWTGPDTDQHFSCTIGAECNLPVPVSEATAKGGKLHLQKGSCEADFVLYPKYMSVAVGNRYDEHRLGYPNMVVLRTYAVCWTAPAEGAMAVRIGTLELVGHGGPHGDAVVGCRRGTTAPMERNSYVTYVFR